MLGQDASEVFGGEGNDFILGGSGTDFLLGNEGDDWIEGGDGFDAISGENSELFFNSTDHRPRRALGQGDDTDYDAESGDDIMALGPRRPALRRHVRLRLGHRQVRHRP